VSWFRRDTSWAAAGDPTGDQTGDQTGATSETAPKIEVKSRFMTQLHILQLADGVEYSEWSLDVVPFSTI